MRCTNSSISKLPFYNGTASRQIRGMFLSFNKITLQVRSLAKLNWLGKLDLSHNRIDDLHEGIFIDLNNLYELILSHNYITDIKQEAFLGLHSLTKLDLSNNAINVLRSDMFLELSSLHHLLFIENPLEDVTQDAFTKLSDLRELNTDAYKFCCIASQTEICTPEADEFSSCEDLMDNFALQVGFKTG